jgi:uncharacterized phiE125 gp8 family phage protein
MSRSALILSIVKAGKPMSSILLNGPAVEPITLAEAKAHLRVEHNDDDAVIVSLIAGSRIHVETQTRRALISQNWRIIRDHWPSDGQIAILPVPLQQIVAARVYESDGSTLAIDTQAFVVDKASAPALVAFAPWSLPAPGRVIGGIELDVKVGYGDGAADVPEPLRQAIRLLVAHWYENRGVTSQRAVNVLPIAVNALIAPYRVFSL